MSLYAPPQAPHAVTPPSPAFICVIYRVRWKSHDSAVKGRESLEREGGRESVDTRFQGYGMVASSCFFPLVSFCSSFCFCFLTFFARCRQLEIETRSSGFNCARKGRIVGSENFSRENGENCTESNKLEQLKKIKVNELLVCRHSAAGVTFNAL